MTTISLVANDQLLSVALNPKLASGDQNSVTLHVDFSTEWDGYARSGVFFTSNDETPYEKVMTNGECTIPAEVLAETGVLFIGVRGVNADNNAVKTSSLVKYKISEGAPAGEGTEVEPTANVYQQLLTAYGKTDAAILKEVADRKSAITAEENARKSEITAEATARKQADAVLEARMNTFTSLGEGSTTGDAELQDIRVDFEGNTHESAGAAVRTQVGKLSEEIEEQKEVPMASINPYKMNLENYDVVINEGRYVTGYNTSTFKPTVTQNNTYNYDVIDMIINHDNCVITVPYDSTQSVGQAFVLYTEGVQANNATPNHVNNKQIGVIEVGTDSYTVNLNASNLNYERVAFTVPKGRRDFYLKSNDEGDLGILIDKKIFNSIVVAPVNMFYSIGAIGDSYTAGSALSSDGVTWQDVTDLSWIATMAKRAGIYYSNYGKGGATTKSYITDKLPSVLSGQAKDLYFIALGINDCLQNISVGTIADIKNDYTQNGATFYGYYGSIITQVQTHAPKSKIVLVKIWTNGTSKTPYDNAIIEIASHFGLPVINPYDDIYFNSSLYLDNMVSGHPTAMGYACMGLAMERLFSKCVVENPNYFKFATIG